MKIRSFALSFVAVLLLVLLLYFTYLLNRSLKLEDKIEYVKTSMGATVNSGKSLSYLIFKRPKGLFGYKYYFGARMGSDNPPFVQKYSPVLDSDRDSFDKIEDLTECGRDTYVLTLKMKSVVDYRLFSVFEKDTKIVDEKVLIACKKGKL
ncbi:hypothetical protein EHO61_01155 [Leptospira fluminis]|uniref:Uncharacterized protein n=1 Tax=Leptospira fluminis TaxID=2484979 RepID=A0A4R9GVN4_9LEPT|nr:hypothetical protein [Leptospira fluminis]TGK22417.1 hypothetical protein EHO61_01155 [Leptospira fluminis]